MSHASSQRFDVAPDPSDGWNKQGRFAWRLRDTQARLTIPQTTPRWTPGDAWHLPGQAEAFIVLEPVDGRYRLQGTQSGTVVHCGLKPWRGCQRANRLPDYTITNE